MPNKDTISEKVAEGLREHPAYLLIFGIIFLILSSSAVIAMQSDDNIIPSVLIIISLIAAVITIVIVERKGKNQVIERPITVTQNEKINESLTSIISNVESGIQKNNDFLNKRIIDIIDTWRAVSINWKDGSFVAKADEYNHVLLSAYSGANESVFSTSTESYSSNWNFDLGKAIIEAHKSSKADVKRVFIFQKRKDISESHLEKIKKHAECSKIDVRIFINDETPYNFPPEISPDFTIIDDGVMIGVTQRFEPSELSAIWYCDNGDRINTFKQVKSNLMNYSYKFSDKIEEFEKI